jgi:tripartite-type tricarboxylate transporter receptor subunit TctC
LPSDLPDIPTFEEIGLKDFFSAAWNAIAAPPGTPRAITARLNEEINAVLGMPDIETHFRDLHLVRMGGSRTDMAEFIKAERLRWEGVIRSANVRLE